MGLLDTTIDNIDKKITRELITNPRGLDFEFSSEYFFRKDINIAKDGFTVYAASGIKLPTFFHTGDEVEILVAFICGYYYNIESQIYISIHPTKIEQMKFKTNLYESIKQFLDEDNIVSYLTDKLQLNLIQ